MLHPSAYYVKYLLVTMWELNQEPEMETAVINDTLRQFGLPDVLMPTVQRIGEGLLVPEDFLLDDPTHEPSAEFMRKEKLSTIWNPTDDMNRTLLEVVGNRRITYTIHLLLMGDVPHNIIAQKVSTKFRLRNALTAGMIDCYAHYFWKASCMSESEWASFLALHPQQDQLMASLLCGEQQALFRAGFSPKYDYKQASRDTHRQISFRIQHLGHLPDDKHTIGLLLRLSREQRSLYDLLYGEGGSLEEQMKEIRRFMMQHKNPGVSPLEDLVGENGSHSEDGEDSLDGED